MDEPIKSGRKMVRLELAIDQNRAKDILDDTFDAGFAPLPSG